MTLKSQRPTHAGGVVYRMKAGKPEFLFVTARRRPQEWVYPKGHIERGETPEETAVREVKEEAGVRGAIVERLGDVLITLGQDHQFVRYFLMTTADDAAPGEGRLASWMAPEEAMTRITYAESRDCLRKAVAALNRRGDIDSGYESP